MRSAQNNGTVIVFAAGNNGALQVDTWGGAPYRITELANEWLVVVAVDSDGIEPAYTNRCGVAAAFCVTAVGGDTSSAAGGVYDYRTAVDAGCQSRTARGQLRAHGY